MENSHVDTRFTVDFDRELMQWGNTTFMVDHHGHTNEAEESGATTLSTRGRVIASDFLRGWQAAVCEVPKVVLIHVPKTDRDQQGQLVQSVLRLVNNLKRIESLSETRIIIVTDIGSPYHRSLVASVQKHGYVLPLTSTEVSTSAASRLVVWRELFQSRFGIELDRPGVHSKYS